MGFHYDALPARCDRARLGAIRRVLRVPNGTSGAIVLSETAKDTMLMTEFPKAVESPQRRASHFDLKSPQIG